MSWDNLEQIMHHTFYNKLRIQPREDDVDYVHVGIQAVLSLRVAPNDGLVLDAGDGVCDHLRGLCAAARDVMDSECGRALRGRAGQGGHVLGSGEELRTAARAADFGGRRAVQVPRGAVPAERCRHPP